ncbi:MAG: hypothetical protein JKY34_12290 [Kordiimonadaceae bacterium]|nr:hypothetical protein [Kordiimonadaceae bacterium]
MDYEEADKLIAALDEAACAASAQLGETECIKVLPEGDHDADHPASDFMGLKNHSENLCTALLRWRAKPEGVPVKIKVPAQATLYVAKKGNHPFLIKERVS